MGFFDLTAKLAFDGSAYEAGLRKATGTADKFAANISNRMKGALGAAFGVGALTVAAKQTLDYSSKLQDLSERLGVSTDNLQQWESAMVEHGGTLEDVTGFIEKMRRAQKNALAGNKEMAASFASVGITFSELKALRAEEIFNRIGKFMNGRDVEKYSAALNEIGGRGSGSLFAALTGGLEEAGIKAREFGLILDKEIIARMDARGERMERFGKRTKNVFARLFDYMATGAEGVEGGAGYIARWFGAASTQPLLNLEGRAGFNKRSDQTDDAIAASYQAEMGGSKLMSEAERKKRLDAANAARWAAEDEAAFQAEQAALKVAVAEGERVLKIKQQIKDVEFSMLGSEEKRATIARQLEKAETEMLEARFAKETGAMSEEEFLKKELEILRLQKEMKSFPSTDIPLSDSEVRKRSHENFSALDRIGIHGLGMNNPQVEISKKQLDALMKVVNNTDPAKLKFPLI